MYITRLLGGMSPIKGGGGRLFRQIVKSEGQGLKNTLRRHPCIYITSIKNIKIVLRQNIYYLV